MAWIQYVQIRDISNPTSFGANDDGFDVAGVECLNGASTNFVMADLTDGTLQSIPTYLPGTTKNGNQIPLSRRNKNQAIGLPGGSGINFVSLGFGGSLIGKFDFVVFNKEGLDLRVIETSFGNPTCANYPEEAEISVSKDGVTFAPISEICQDGSLDLGGLTWIQYVKIVDASQIGSSRFNGAADGFDVDAVVALQACSNGANSRMANTDNITEPDAEWTANLYPNPTSDRANLELVDLPTDDVITYELFDATGRLLVQEKHQLRDGQINISIDVKHLPMGSYQVRIITSVGLKVLKLIKLS